jgi:hypothetical protein
VIDAVKLVQEAEERAARAEERASRAREHAVQARRQAANEAARGCAEGETLHRREAEIHEAAMLRQEEAAALQRRHVTHLRAI